MRKLLTWIVLLLLIKTTCAQMLGEGTHISLDAGLRADRNCVADFHAKVLRHRRVSFAVKVARFNYEEEMYVRISPKINSIYGWIGANYSISGLCVKPAFLLLTTVTPRVIHYVSIAGVASQASHKFVLHYSDSRGQTEEVHFDAVTVFGAESEAYFAYRILKNLHLGACLAFGIKANDITVFEKEIDGLKAYRKYTPAQGFGQGPPLYLSATLSLGVNF